MNYMSNYTRIVYLFNSILNIENRIVYNYICIQNIYVFEHYVSLLKCLHVNGE